MFSLFEKSLLMMQYATPENKGSATQIYFFIFFTFSFLYFYFFPFEIGFPSSENKRVGRGWGGGGGSFARALLLARKVNFLFFSLFPFFLLFYLFYCSKFELRTPCIKYIHCIILILDVQAQHLDVQAHIERNS